MIGGFLGVLIVGAIGPLFGSIFFGLQPTDVPIMATAAVMLGVVALAAGYVPARRASRVDPVTALRFE